MTWLKDTSLSKCATVTKVSGMSYRDFSEQDSMQQFLESISTDSGVSGGLKSTMYSMKASVSKMTQSSSSDLSTFHSTHLDITTITHTVDFREDGKCLDSVEYFNEDWLSAFTSLGLIEASQAEDASSWLPYVNFLSKGSHVMMQQQIGSRFQQWESSTSDSKDTAKTLQIKACAQVEGLSAAGGWSVQGCAAYNSAEKMAALKSSSSSSTLVLGGTRDSRAALQKGVTQETLDAFIDDAESGTEAVAFRFKPIWEILISIYGVRCAQGGSDDCDHLQRAYNLQAAHEGWLAFQCAPMYTADNAHWMQKMVAHSNSNIQTYSCMVNKFGCYEDSDCHNGGTIGAACYCYGNSCMAQGDSIAGTDEHRIRAIRSYVFESDVNPSCWYPFLQPCRCNKAWNGGGNTAIWRQIYAETEELLV